MTASQTQRIEIAAVRHLRPSIDIPNWATLLPVAVACVVAILPLAESRLGAGPHASVAGSCLLAFLFVAGYFQLVRKTGHADSVALAERQDRWPSSTASVLCRGTKRELLDVLDIPAPLPEPFVVSWCGVSKLIFWPFLLIGVPALRLIGFSSVLAHMVWISAALLLRFMRLSHRYYRVFPGHLQLLRGPLFSSQISVERDISLDRSTIVCLFDHRKMFVTQSDGERETIDLTAIDHPHALVQAVVRAAVFPLSSVEPSRSALMG